MIWECEVQNAETLKERLKNFLGSRAALRGWREGLGYNWIGGTASRHAAANSGVALEAPPTPLSGQSKCRAGIAA